MFEVIFVVVLVFVLLLCFGFGFLRVVDLGLIAFACLGCFGLGLRVSFWFVLVMGWCCWWFFDCFLCLLDVCSDFYLGLFAISGLVLWCLL